jgi:hypothetical protein
LLNDAYESVAKAAITVTLCYDGKEESLIRWDCPGTDAFNNVQGPTVHFRIPQMKSNLFTVKVTVEGKSEYNSSYTLVYSGKDVKKVFPPKEYDDGKE